MTSISENQIRAEVERMCERGALSKRSRTYELLNYLIDMTLAGEQGKLKAYTIALDVFGRSADFDPKTNSLVRVEMHRLRRSLNEYADYPPEDAEITITIPIKEYTVHFNPVDRSNQKIKNGADSGEDHGSNDGDDPSGEPEATPTPPAPGKQNSHGWAVAAAAMVVVGLSGMFLFFYNSWPQEENQCALDRPGVYLEYDPESPRLSRIATEIRLDLTQFHLVDLLDRDPGECASSPVFKLLLEEPADGETVFANLTTATGRTAIWSNEYDRPEIQQLEPEQLIAARLSYDIAERSDGIPNLALQEHWGDQDNREKYRYLVLAERSFGPYYHPNDEPAHSLSCLRKYAFEENSGDHAAMLAALQFSISGMANRQPPQEEFDADEMKQAMETAQQYGPNNKDYLLATRRMLQYDRDLDRVRKDLEATNIATMIEKRFPTHPILLGNIAIVEVWPLDKPDEALEHAKLAQAIAPETPGIVWSEAYAQLAKGNWDRLGEMRNMFSNEESWFWLLVRMKVTPKEALSQNDYAQMRKQMSTQGIRTVEDARSECSKLGFGKGMRTHVMQLAEEHLPSQPIASRENFESVR